MKKLLSSLTAMFLVLAMVPIALGAEAGTGIGIEYGLDEVAPLVYLDPDSRVWYDDPASGEEDSMIRMHNYAFEGESIRQQVLVIDCNGIDKVADVFGYADASDQNAGFDSIETDCYAVDRTDSPSDIGITQCDSACCQDLEEFNPATMRWYQCDFFVETPESMYGEYWMGFGAIDMDDLEGTAAETEYWFLNPELAINVYGDIDFGTMVPGGVGYSDTLLLTNEADQGSGVMMAMSMSGTDFFDPDNSGASCPAGNILRLNSGGDTGYRGSDQWLCSANPEDGSTGQGDNFCYYATNGAFSTNDDPLRADAEGYVGIPYESVSGDPNVRVPIITGLDNPEYMVHYGTMAEGVWFYRGSVLSPGDDVALTFRLNLPAPCNGQFTDGEFLFWGEAI
jgi:hypothetical protein